MKSSLLRTALVTFFILVLLSSAHAGDEAPAARAYHDFVIATIDKVDHNAMASITHAAELAAKPFIDGKSLGVRGGASLNEELGARSGGFVCYRAEAGKPGDVILYAFGVTTAAEPDAKKLLETELADAEKLTSQNSTVIGIASFAQLKSLGLLNRAQKACAVLLDNYAPAEDGLFKSKNGRDVVPTFTTANAIVAWTWMSELFAACTRAGKTPAMYQSIVTDVKLERYKKYEGKRFHDDITVAPQEAGKLGHAYLKSLKAIEQEIGTAAWKAVVAACDRASGTLKDGGKVYLFAQGHYPPAHLPGVLAHDPNIFTAITATGTKLSAEPGLADLVIGIGYAFTPMEKMNGVLLWGNPDTLRMAGQGVIWVVNDYRFTQSDLDRNEMIVPQCWREGDAEVTVPGYDVRIIPASGVVAESMMWMMTAQVWSDLNDSPAQKNK
ncbi:MAG: hypothetical protein IT444_13850 [Phycisphaeraceae bacterium]|nr:hypothetical protein [Phycisphaeraceae bacterium]